MDDDYNKRETENVRRMLGELGASSERESPQAGVASFGSEPAGRDWKPAGTALEPSGRLGGRGV